MDIIRHHFSIIPSTNTWAKQHAEAFDPRALTIVTADEQTAGRGRFNRQWVSPGNQNIYATYCVFLEKGRQDIGNLPQVAAIAIAELLQLMGFKPLIKWPNDVILHEKKVAGILSESTLIEDKLCLLIGIGLNVNMPQDVLQKIDRPATSLLDQSGQVFDVSTVLQQLTDILLSKILLFLTDGFTPFLQTYRSWLYRSETMIRFHDHHKIVEGTITSFNDDGSLTLALKTGGERTFYAGEILFAGCEA